MGEINTIKILYLSHLYPYPPNDGGRILTYHTIKSDVDNGIEVFLLAFNESAIHSPLDQIAKVHVVTKNTRSKTSGMFWNLFSSLPYTLSKFIDERVIKVCKDILQTHSIDLIVIDSLHMAFYIDFLKKGWPDLPIILRQHNVESTIMFRFFQNQTNPIVRLYGKYQYHKLFDFERKSIEKVDRCFAISEEDRRRTIRMSPQVAEKTITIPAGVDSDKYHPLDQAEDTNSIIFSGNMGWLPNEDGIIWFYKNIFEKLKRDIPLIKFYIVGKDPSRRILRLNDNKNVIVTGFVEDERGFIARSMIFIDPIRIGGGIRLKILNAMAMAKPVVTTSVGAEGIVCNDGEDIMIADDENDFYQKIITLFKDDKKRQNIGTRGRKTVVENYSWEKITQKMHEEYLSLIRRNIRCKES